MPAPRDPEIIVRAARLYYESRHSQDEIARALGTSRSNVSRILSAAQDLGIVEVRINDPAGRMPDLEAALAERFGLRDVVVAQRAANASVRIQDRVGALAWEWLRRHLDDGMTIGVSWGRSLQSMVQAIGEESARSVRVVPLVGGLSAVASEQSGQELVREMATRLGASYQYLHAPAVFSSSAARDALLREVSVAQALDGARQASIAVVGIGAVHSGSSSAILRAFQLTAAEQAAFEAAHPVGDVLARFYDIKGHEVPGAVHDRVLAVSLDDLRGIPTVMAVAPGREKVQGILGAVNGGFIDVLVTDAAAARGLLAQD